MEVLVQHWVRRDAEGGKQVIEPLRLVMLLDSVSDCLNNIYLGTCPGLRPASGDGHSPCGFTHIGLLLVLRVSSGQFKP